MGRKMARAPVYFAIVQARFNPILALDAYAPQIQERMRKQGFPDVQKGVLTTLDLNLAAPNEAVRAQVPIVHASRYTFGSSDRTSGFILDQSAMSFQTTEYDVFETFSAEFLRGLQAVHEAVELSYTDRIGVRYLDAVFPRPGETLPEYLTGSVLGLAEKLDGIVHAFSETLARKGDTSVLARIIVQKGDVGFPPDLHPVMLNLAERFRQLRGQHAILDTDCFSESRQPFNLEHIRDRLASIHAEITTAFRATITEKAIKAWE